MVEGKATIIAQIKSSKLDILMKATEKQEGELFSLKYTGWDKNMKYALSCLQKSGPSNAAASTQQLSTVSGRSSPLLPADARDWTWDLLYAKHMAYQET